MSTRAWLLLCLTVVAALTFAFFVPLVPWSIGQPVCGGPACLTPPPVGEVSVTYAYLGPGAVYAPHCHAVFACQPETWSYTLQWSHPNSQGVVNSIRP